MESKALNWLLSYLKDRTIQVKLNGTLSFEIKADIGVPQGSHLGPVLFSIFINVIGLCIDADFEIFADDCKLHRLIKSNMDTVILQDDLNKIVK